MAKAKTHPQLEEARKRLRTIGAYIPGPVTRETRRWFYRLWIEAAAKDETGTQCVRLVDDIIERNQPLAA